ncbi:MAG: hypothetical protein JW944_04370, partial [Deltaproteobacteria bacterium]|nr:hypothetical protein [Deltaproteobacteria bacterium]
QPFALLIGVTEDNVEESLREVRRAMFSKAITGARKKAALNHPKEIDIANEIKKSRKSRGVI